MTKETFPKVVFDSLPGSEISLKIFPPLEFYLFIVFWHPQLLLKVRSHSDS